MSVKRVNGSKKPLDTDQNFYFDKYIGTGQVL